MMASSITPPRPSTHDGRTFGGGGAQAGSGLPSETGESPSSGGSFIAPRAQVKVFIVEGALDFERNPDLYCCLDSAIGDSTADVIILDLHACSHIIKAALGELVHLVRAAEGKGIRVLLARPAPTVARLLDTTRLTRFFSVFASLEAAEQAAVEARISLANGA